VSGKNTENVTKTWLVSIGPTDHWPIQWGMRPKKTIKQTGSIFKQRDRPEAKDIASHWPCPAMA